jgi:hypothetical protein
MYSDIFGEIDEFMEEILAFRRVAEEFVPVQFRHIYNRYISNANNIGCSDYFF